MILHEIVVFEMISHLVKSPQNRVFRSKEYMKIYVLGSEFSTQRVCICPSATEHIVGTEIKQGPACSAPSSVLIVPLAGMQAGRPLHTKAGGVRLSAQFFRG